MVLIRESSFALRAFQCYGSRPSECARHESKLDQTQGVLVSDILHIRHH